MPSKEPAMRRRRRVLLSQLVLLSVAFAPAPLPRRGAPADAAADLAAMQGEWVLDHSHSGGMRTPADEQQTVWLFEGDAVTTYWGGRRASRFSVRLDRRQRPGAIDVRQGAALVPGRYGLSGDTLTVC